MIVIWQFINNWFSSIYNCLHTLCVFEIYLQYPVKDRQYGVVKLVYLWHQYSPAETNSNSTQMALFQVALSQFCSCISVDVFILFYFFCIRFVDSIYLWISCIVRINRNTVVDQDTHDTLHNNILLTITDMTVDSEKKNK
jgi:hypothetical protein